MKGGMYGYYKDTLQDNDQYNFLYKYYDETDTSDMVYLCKNQYKMLNKKCKHLYIHTYNENNYIDDVIQTYDPMVGGARPTYRLVTQRHINARHNDLLRISNQNIKYYPDPETFVDNSQQYNIRDVIDSNVYNNCCNCFVYSLYITNKGFGQDMYYEHQINILYYLICITQSIKNAEYHFNDWIFRIYIDFSVLDMISYNKLSDDTKKTSNLNYIINLLDALFIKDNVEIIVPICDLKYSQHTSRMYRLIPLSEPDVNYVIVRDADSILTNLECCNIKHFIKSDKIFYHTIIDNDTVKNQPSYSYSPWLNIYKIYFDNFYRNNDNMFDILAGLASFKFKIKKEMFDLKLKEIDNFYNFLQTNIKVESDNDNTYAGLDEIFLRHLTRDIFSYTNNIMFNIKMKHIYYPYYNIIDINGNNIEEIVKNTKLKLSISDDVDINITKQINTLYDRNNQDFITYGIGYEMESPDTSDNSKYLAIVDKIYKYYPIDNIIDIHINNIILLKLNNRVMNTVIDDYIDYTITINE